MCDADPKVIEFLCADPPTDAIWTSFLSYLRKRYGRTRRQRIQSLITGTDFNGLQPSAVCAAMKEKAGTVTVDDIIKEQLYRRLPVDLQRQLAQEAESMNASELAELADAFFDKDGRPLHAASNTSVNAIGGGVSNSFNPNASAPNLSSSSTSVHAATAAQYRPSDADAFTSAFEDDAFDVNAIRAPKQRQNNSSRPQNSVNNSANRYSNSSKRENLTTIGNDGICGYHRKFQNDAFKCASGCRNWPKFQSKNAQARQRRM